MTESTDEQVVPAEDNSVAAAVSAGSADPGPSSAVTYSDTGVVGLAPAPLSTFERIARSGVEPLVPENMADLVDVEALNEIAAVEAEKLAKLRGEGEEPNSYEDPAPAEAPAEG